MKFVFLFIIMALSLQLYAQDEKSDIEARIKNLEIHQEELLLQITPESQRYMSSFLKDNLTFGGFFSPAYTMISGPDTETQASSSENLLGLNLAADYNQRLHFSSQIITGIAYRLSNENNNPNSQESETREFPNPGIGARLRQGYLEFSFNNQVRIQGGLGYSPFGYAVQLKEPVLYIRRAGPQLLRTTDFISGTWSGVNILGRYSEENYTWGYNIYSFNPLNGPKHPGLGARARLSSHDERLMGGLSTQLGKVGAKSFETFGSDLRYYQFPFLLTTELAYSFYEEDDSWSVYAEPGMYFANESILLYVSMDYIQNNSNELKPNSTIRIRDPFQKWEFGTGVNWLPTAFTRLRLGLIYHDYVGSGANIDGQNRDYIEVDLSAGVSF